MQAMSSSFAVYAPCAEQITELAEARIDPAGIAHFALVLASGREIIRRLTSRHPEALRNWARAS
jgi:hypothetical protein